ncbi:MAG: hypothetical protein IT176_03360 [Acidobacteria bacterium]|nr:hypothetical protein [Acidobacteriota bacterium]
MALERDDDAERLHRIERIREQFRGKRDPVRPHQIPASPVQKPTPAKVMNPRSRPGRVRREKG